MMTRSGRMRRFLAMTLIIGLLAVSRADAHGGHGGHSGGHSGAMPRGHRISPGPSGRTRHLECLTRQPPPAQTPRQRNRTRRTNISSDRWQTHNTQARAMAHTSLASNNRSSSRTTATGDCEYTYQRTARHNRHHAPMAFPRILTPMVPATALAIIGPTAMATVTVTVSYGRGYGYGRSQGNNRAIVVAAEVCALEPGADRSRLPGAPRPRDACGFDGDPSALAPVDGLRRHGIFVRHEQRPGHGDATGRRRQQWRGSPASAHVPGPVRRPDEPRVCGPCRGSTCSSAARGTIPRAMVGPADTFSRQSTS